MNEIEALHAGARRYCMEGMWGDSVDYDVLAGILRHIETVVPTEFSTVQSLRDFLIEAGQHASRESNARTRGSKWRQSRTSIIWRFIPGIDAADEGELDASEKEERSRFCDHIGSLGPQDLEDIEPLPMRRVLGDREAEKLYRRLRRKWHMPSDSPYWYPLVDEGEPPPNVLAFADDAFEHHVPIALLQTWLRERQARPAIEFDNDNMLDCEMDLDLLDPWKSETFWTSAKMDWVIYHSHEASVTVGGDWLLTLIRRVWRDWDNSLRTTHAPFEAMSRPESEHGE